MSEYIFENKDKKMFGNCTGDEIKQIVEGAKDGRVELFNSNAWYLASRSTTIFFINDIYRVLSPTPTPNQIDWPKVPKEYKYCFVNRKGLGQVSVKLPVETELTGAPCLKYSGFGWVKKLSEGEYGFKRGTVESIDSLLVRPLGE